MNKCVLLAATVLACVLIFGCQDKPDVAVEKKADATPTSAPSGEEKKADAAEAAKPAKEPEAKNAAAALTKTDAKLAALEEALEKTSDETPSKAPESEEALPPKTSREQTPAMAEKPLPRSQPAAVLSADAVTEKKRPAAAKPRKTEFNVASLQAVTLSPEERRRRTAIMKQQLSQVAAGDVRDVVLADPTVKAAAWYSEQKDPAKRAADLEKNIQNALERAEVKGGLIWIPFPEGQLPPEIVATVVNAIVIRAYQSPATQPSAPRE